MMAVNPQIIKLYAKNEKMSGCVGYKKFQNIVWPSSRYFFSFVLCHATNIGFMAC